MKKSPILVALVLAAPAFAHQAGAQTVDQCAGSAAFNTQPTLPANMVEGGTYTVSLDRRPACSTTPVCVADHITKSLQWDPSEVQPLGSSVCTDGPALTFTVAPHPDRQCLNHQADLITGPPLQTVDSTHRYNETAIGGDVNRLISVAYVESTTTVCGQHPDPTTTLPTIVVQRETPLPPISTAPSSPPPGAVDQAGPELTPHGSGPATIPDIVHIADPILPVTGAHTAWTVGLGGGLILFGLGLLGLRRRTIKENQ